MSAEYSRGILRIVVAQICQTIGWHSINSTPLEFMVDLMQEYFLRIYRLSHQYTEILGRTEVNENDVGLAFQHLGISIPQLSEYVRNVDSVPCAIQVPKFPRPRENHLNFLKPGSKEVVTRPVHIHEHLPAMHPDNEELPEEKMPENLMSDPQTLGQQMLTSNHETTPPNDLATENVFKRPGDPLSDSPVLAKRAKMNDESRPLREIHSVMMTTSGFLSPAREGKLPESRTPAQARPDSPPPISYPMVPPELKVVEKKPKKIVKKNLEDRKLDKENKKKNRDKDLFKPDKIVEPKVKKLAGMKETAKLKALKPGGGKGLGPSLSTSPIPPVHVPEKESSAKIPKNISPKMKSEKPSPSLSVTVKKDDIDKLPSEPDKQKLNIFKKISKPRDDKASDIFDHQKHKDVRTTENSSSLSINDLNEKFNRGENEVKKDEKKVPHTPEVVSNDREVVDLRSPSSDVYTYFDMSPPGTPSTPKTPELNVPGPTPEPKKKRKDKGRKKENLKSPTFRDSPYKAKMSNDMMDVEVLGRPKTPEALETVTPREMNIPSNLPFPFFPPFPSAPGLIPHPIGHPMFPRFPLPLGPRGAPTVPPLMHNLPLPSRFMPPPMKMEDIPAPKIKPFEHMPTAITAEQSVSRVDDLSRVEIDKIGKVSKIPKQDKPAVIPVVKAASRVDSFVPAAVGLPQETPLQKLEKLERLDKKSKKHKIEKKEKMKKKKEKKDKHKEKPEKNKEKKEKLEKLKEKKEKKEKRKDKEEKEAEAVPKITLKLGTASPRPPTPDNPLLKKITIKPLPKKPEDIIKRESSPELAKISALVTRPPKQKTPKVKSESVSKKEEVKDNGARALLEPPPATIVDQGGQQIWICPACGNQDDGSPMIGCDSCDGWYHWVCVGMQVPPAAKENWYCRFCIAKKQELHHDKKKKKRKKKVKIAV